MGEAPGTTLPSGHVAQSVARPALADITSLSLSVTGREHQPAEARERSNLMNRHGGRAVITPTTEVCVEGTP